MFYPVQSVRYTLQITKTLWLTLKEQSLIGARIIFFLLIGAFLGVSWILSISFGVLFILLIWISIIDLYDQIIPDILLLGTFLTLFWLYPVPNFIVSAFIVFMVVIVKVGMEKAYKKNLIGWGDIKLIALLIIFTQVSLFPIFFLISGCGALLASSLIRKRQIPLGPFIVLGFMSVISAGLL